MTMNRPLGEGPQALITRMELELEVGESGAYTGNLGS